MLHTVGGWGLGRGMIWSSAWIGWGSLRPDGDGREGRDQEAGVENALADRQDGGVQRYLLVERAVHQQVVDADGAGALEEVVGGHDAELDFEAAKVVVEGVDEVGLDGVLDNRVALLGDEPDMGSDCIAGQR